MPKRFWTPAEEEIMRAHYAHALTVELARQFGCDPKRVLAKANAMGLHKSVELIAATARERSSQPDHGGHRSAFKPGLVPWNKGKPGSTGLHPNCRPSQFTQGARPHTWVPVGSYRITQDGNLKQKVHDLPGDHNKVKRWRNCAAMAWEAAHGPVPRGHIVVFKPGLKTTDPALVTIDRLECISRAQNVQRNSLHRYPKEIVRLTMLRGSLTRAINTKAKEAKTA